MTSIVAFLQKHEQKFTAVALAVLVAALSLHTLDGFWRADDTALLAHALKHGLWDIFFSPVAWQELTTANLTPWESLSYYLDYTLTGLHPSLFYLHQALSLWLVAVISIELFSLYMKRSLAVAGVLLFLLGTPVLRISDQLMTRHYLEGLLLSLLALYFFLRYRQTGKVWQQIAAVLCYLLVVTTKEIYVPVGVLLILLANGNWPQRFRQSLPFVIVIVLYVLWRHYMLPGLVGGYAQGSVYLTLHFWQEVLFTFFQIPAVLFGSFAVFVATPLFIVIAVGTVLQRRAWLWTLILAGMVLTPLIPLVAYPGISAADRYLLLPWFALCFAFVFNLAVVLRRLAATDRTLLLNAAGMALCGILAALLLAERVQVQHSEQSYYQAIDTQMHYIWDHDGSQAFVPGNGMATSFWMIKSLGEIKQMRNPLASIPRPIVDDIFLNDSLPLYEYSAQCHCMQDISSTIPQRLAQFRQARTAPLTITISNDDGLISWKFGPYTGGSYYIVSELIGSIRLAASQNALRTNIRGGVDFYLRYNSPEGWSTYSSLLHLEPDGKEFRWGRE